MAIRLVKWTGKSTQYIHPKHLIKDDHHHWFVKFLRAGDQVLDLGCGGGAHSFVAAEHVKAVKGIDHSSRNLEIAKRLASEKKLTNVQFAEGDLEKPLDEKDQTYDVVIALDILEHLHNREQFLNEAARVLKPAGRLVVAIPNRDTQWKKALKRHGLFYYSDLDHKYEYEQSELDAVFKRGHFSIRSIEPAVYDTPWVGLIDLIGGVSIGWYRKLADWKRSMALKYPSESTGFRIEAVKN